MNTNSNTNKVLLKVQNDLEQFKPIFAKATQSVLERGISRYPVFVLHQHGANIGLPLLEREHIHSHWSVNLSTLEELVARKIVAPGHVESFKETYGAPSERMCLLVLDEEWSSFVFYAY